MVVGDNALQYFDPVMRKIQQSVAPVREIVNINDIEIDDRGVFVATNDGVARLRYFSDLDQCHWFERFIQLGSFTAQTTVNGLVVLGDYLWAATNEGVARGDLNSPAPL